MLQTAAVQQRQPSRHRLLVLPDQLQINLFQRGLADDVVQNAQLQNMDCHAAGVRAALAF